MLVRRKNEPVLQQHFKRNAILSLMSPFTTPCYSFALGHKKERKREREREAWNHETE